MPILGADNKQHAAGCGGCSASDGASAPLQGAYGILAEVESHPFPTDAMLFMDWRDDHTAGDAGMRDSNRCLLVRGLAVKEREEVLLVMQADAAWMHGFQVHVLSRPFICQALPSRCVPRKLDGPGMHAAA